MSNSEVNEEFHSEETGVLRACIREQAKIIEQLELALRRFANRDNWVGDRYRGTICGPATAECALKEAEWIGRRIPEATA